MFAAASYDPLVPIHLGPLAISPHGTFAALAFRVGALLLGDTAGDDGDQATVGS